MTSPRARIAALVVAVVLIAGACSSGGTDTQAGGSESSDAGSGGADSGAPDTAGSTGDGDGSDSDRADDADDDSGDSGDSGNSGDSGDSGDAGSGAGDAVSPEQAANNAAANIDSLEATDDVRTYEVLDVSTGTPTTISDVVTGDRPVLLWFWAPH